MSVADASFVAMVILSLTAFAGTLAVVGWRERSWAKKNGK